MDTTSLYKILNDPTLQFWSQKWQIANWAQNQISYPPISDSGKKLMEKQIICDLFEGHFPTTPRYILPDYQRFFEQGSDFLELKAPSNFFEAINHLLIIYRFVPSVIGYPVYLGNVDTLLEPFSADIDDQTLNEAIGLFLTNVARTLPSAFVHLNLGPMPSRVGTSILNHQRIQKNASPNISLKVDKFTANHPDFLLTAVNTALTSGAPYFVNHEKMVESWGGTDYGIASCYNSLRIGGGSHTLVRLNLKTLTVEHKISSLGELIEELPSAMECLINVINTRAQQIVEKTGFFDNSFLVKEHLLSLDKFTSMAGIVGLHECLENINAGKLGQDQQATESAHQIFKIITEVLTQNKNKGLYCGGNQGRIGLHAQSGIDSDIDTTPGVRIKIGEEPTSLWKQLSVQSELQKYFDTGVSDIHIFDQTAIANPEGVLKIISAGLEMGIKTLAINTSNSDLIRVSGYLIKRSDYQKYKANNILRDESAGLAVRAIDNGNVMNRKVRTI